MKQKTPAKIHYPAFITGLQRIINIRDIGDFKPHKFFICDKRMYVITQIDLFASNFAKTNLDCETHGFNKSDLF